jgi:hypothetical protein
MLHTWSAAIAHLARNVRDRSCACRTTIEPVEVRQNETTSSGVLTLSAAQAHRQVKDGMGAELRGEMDGKTGITVR